MMGNFEYSVIVPVFNAEKFLERAVESALQFDEVKEVIIIEDGSTDNSLEICTNIAKNNRRIKLLRHPNGENKGAGSSRNLGILNSEFDLVAFLDADDYYLPNRFEKEKAVFETNPHCDGVYGALGVEYIDDDGAKIWESKGLNEKTLTTVNLPIPHNELFEHLIGINVNSKFTGYFSVDTLTINRNALIKNNLVFNDKLRLHQDTFFIWTCAFKLSLVTGEYENAISIRGVHKSNRILTEKNYHFTRLLLYKQLYNWSTENKLIAKYKTFFMEKYYENYFKNVDSVKLKVVFDALIIDFYFPYKLIANHLKEMAAIYLSKRKVTMY